MAMTRISNVQELNVQVLLDWIADSGDPIFWG
jgi:hypothetical protein